MLASSCCVEVLSLGFNDFIKTAMIARIGDRPAV